MSSLVNDSLDRDLVEDDEGTESSSNDELYDWAEEEYDFIQGDKEGGLLFADFGVLINTLNVGN